MSKILYISELKITETVAIAKSRTSTNRSNIPFEYRALLQFFKCIHKILLNAALDDYDFIIIEIDSEGSGDEVFSVANSLKEYHKYLFKKVHILSAKPLVKKIIKTK